MMIGKDLLQRTQVGEDGEGKENDGAGMAGKVAKLVAVEQQLMATMVVVRRWARC